MRRSSETSPSPGPSSFGAYQACPSFWPLTDFDWGLTKSAAPPLQFLPTQYKAIKMK
jgi:hypothetical protein